MVVKSSLPRSGITCWSFIRELSPCENSCPVNMNIPGFVISIAQEEFDESYAIMRESNPFPGICGYVCHHPCEEVCSRAKLDEPISIKSLKRFVVDYKLSQGTEKVIPIKADKEKVAIIGSGPAGLTAAHDLAKQGYSVTVFEAMPVAGGMLATGIPEFVLPRKIPEAEIDYIKKLGVEIKTGVQIGKDLSLHDVMQQGFKAVFIAVGIQRSLKLNLPGLDLAPIHYALSFLQDVNLGKKVQLGSRVVVIGGGNVAIDTARAAIRLGASEVNLACLESREQMPAFTWEIESAEEEGIKIHCSRAPLEIVGKDGKVTGVNFAGVESIGFDKDGRIKPVLIEGSKYAIEADCVIIAIGQGLDQSILEGMKGLELNKKGNIAADPDTLSTNLPGVFAGGDAVSGGTTVVDAIAAGHKAALSVDRYIRGEELKDAAKPKKVIEIEEEKLPRFTERRERARMPKLSTKERIGSFKGVELGFSREAALEEAKRCLNCPICGNCIFGQSQACIETIARLY